ncbi:MAG: tetratricopeptide repeat protein [Candidatus Obscuribacterales bacterium]
MKNANDAQPDRQIELPVEDGLTNIKSVSQRADELLLAEKFAEAEQLYRELCLGLEVLLGAAHPDVAEVRHKLAAALSGQGKTDEAAAQEQSAQIIKSALKH